MIRRVATCHCGQLAIECDGEPRRISLCHCLACQRRTGSAFSIAVFFERTHTRVRGVARQYERNSESGAPVRFHFCGTCGSSLFWEPSRLPERIGVAAGGFADPAIGTPAQSVHTRHKHEWIDLPPGMERHEAGKPPAQGIRERMKSSFSITGGGSTNG